MTMLGYNVDGKILSLKASLGYGIWKKKTDKWLSAEIKHYITYYNQVYLSFFKTGWCR